MSRIEENVAGEGSRLHPLTSDMSKSMFKLGQAAMINGMKISCFILIFLSMTWWKWIITSFYIKIMKGAIRKLSEKADIGW